VIAKVLRSPVPMEVTEAGVPGPLVGEAAVNVYCSPLMTPTPAAVPLTVSNAAVIGPKPRVHWNRRLTGVPACGPVWNAVYAKSTVCVPELVAVHCEVRVVVTLKLLLAVPAACAFGTIENAAATAAARTLFKAFLPLN